MNVLKKRHPVPALLNITAEAAAVLIIAASAGPVSGQTHPSLDSAVICGYQGWFACYNDGSPIDRWNHWCGGQYHSDNPKPSPGYQSFELYPDIAEFPDAALFQTGYATLGDGRPSRLFSSYREETIDLHFKWMRDNGIDGVALQRFLSETRNALYKANRDSISLRVMRAAEKYGRMFYLMYDGIGNNMDSLIADWQNTMVGKLKITASPRYAYMNGKPVVCFWGFGFTHYTDTAADALRAITWFKNSGYYVIGGVPTNWRTGTSDSKTGYGQVYSAYDMVSPWTVGRYKYDVEVDNYRTGFLIPDKAKLDSLGTAYQPVIFPGFAWSNWNGGARNDFPRRQGKLMWRQLYNVKSLGIRHLYVAMFDEYDEGTAIAKAAADYFDVPANQYFQTLSIDSIYLSSDFYLRLAGAAGKVMRGILPNTLTVPIPNSAGPIYFRSSFEPVDAQLTWVSRADTQSGGFQNVTGYAGTGTPECAVVIGTAQNGAQAIRYRGAASSTAHAMAYCRAIAAAIPVDARTTLSYAINPQSALGRYAGIDLVMTDGTTLRGSGAVDTAGASMHPSTGRGTVSQWTKVKCMIGNWLAGKTIDRILVAFDHAGQAGQYIGSIDNLVIQTENTPSAIRSPGWAKGRPLPLSALYSGEMLTIRGWQAEWGKEISISIFTPGGKRVIRQRGTGTALPVSLSPNVYIVVVENAAAFPWIRKLVVVKQ